MRALRLGWVALSLLWPGEAALATGEEPPAALACLSKWYPVEPVRSEGRWMARLPGGKLYPFDDGREKSFEEKLAAPDLEDTFSQAYRTGPLVPVTQENEDPGRIRFDPLFHAAYGASEALVDVVGIRFLGQKLRVHRKVAPAFGRVEKRLEAALRRLPPYGPT